jgi:photosystem II stability/assembly factor-like uncharacterized protein
MAVQTRESPAPPGQEIAAGVIEDARARQRKHRGIAVALIVAAAVAASLIVGFVGGGGDSLAGGHHAGGSGAGGAAHASDQAPAPASLRMPPHIGEFGLLAPRIGWAVNGIGFFITRDGGRRWRAARVPNLNGDILAELYATASPAPSAVVLSFTTGSSTYDRLCPGAPGPAIGAGALAISTDSGRRWRATPLPACELASSLSFLNPRAGFALVHQSPTRQVIYATTDGARNWHRRGTIPLSNASGSIAFATLNDGAAVRFSRAALGSSERGRLYRTTDGGRNWAPSNICRATPVRSVTTTCQTPSFFGTNGVMPAVATNAESHSSRLLVYTTKTAGRAWSPHPVPAGQALKRYITQQQPIPFSAPNARDLFVFLSGTLYKSLNAGRNWMQLSEPDLSGLATLDFASAQYGWIQTNRHFDSTTDGGSHWKAIGGR